MLVSEDDSSDLDTPLPRPSDFERQPDPQLVEEGWERRFTADTRRVKEYMDAYSSMGFEVRVEPVRREEVGPECGDCSLILSRLFATLYTRRPASGA